MKKYDIILKMLADRLDEPIMQGTRDIMSLVTLYNTNCPLAYALFTKTLTSMYLLHIAQLPIDGELLNESRDEYDEMIRSIEKFRNKLMNLADEEQLISYSQMLHKKQFHA